MLSLIASPIGRKIATGAALVAILALGLWWVRYDAASDREAELRAAADAARIRHIEDAKGKRDDAENLDDDSLLDALSRWIVPAPSE